MTEILAVGAYVRLHAGPEPAEDYDGPAWARIHTAPEPIEDYDGPTWARIHTAPEPIEDYPGPLWPRYHVTNELINTPFIVRFEVLAGIPWVWVNDHWERVDAARRFDGAEWQPMSTSAKGRVDDDWENIS